MSCAITWTLFEGSERDHDAKGIRDHGAKERQYMSDQKNLIGGEGRWAEAGSIINGISRTRWWIS